MDTPLWQSRQQSWDYLVSQHPSRLTVIIRCFDLIDRCLNEYENQASASTYARICGLTLLKGKNLAHGSLTGR